jgi:hypothetical protein
MIPRLLVQPETQKFPSIPGEQLAESNLDSHRKQCPLGTLDSNASCPWRERKLCGDIYVKGA